MNSLFVADLHLSPSTPQLTAAFIALLQREKTRVQALYILGDWFEAWIGDDDPEPWLRPIVKALQEFSANGNIVYVQHGNRDFLLGQAFCDRFAGQLLPSEFDISHPLLGAVRLEHGDRLCTDDIAYQAFRQKSRTTAWRNNTLALPLFARRLLAKYMRYRSKMNHRGNSHNYIVDVSEQTVAETIAPYNYIVHGHTHRPAVHTYGHKQRVVVGDWRLCDAVIARLDEQGIRLETLQY